MWEIGQKIGQLNIKTKIYPTIEGLIILFIKLQLSNQMYQAFRPLCTSTSNLDLKLSLNLIALSFVLSPIHLYYPQYASFLTSDLAYTRKGFYASNQVKCKPMYLSGLGATDLHTKKLLSSSQCPD